MRAFEVALTGDYLDARGQSAYGDIRLELLSSLPHVAWRFLHDLAPRPGDASYWSRLYSLQITPEHIRHVHGLIVLRPWVTRATFDEGAAELVVIGRSGAGYDKIDLEACTAHGVAVFNAPDALDHATASSALLFMLALAKRLREQDAATRAGRWDMQSALMGREIAGRTLGIIGFGRSGKELARLISPFRMRLLVHTAHATPEEVTAAGAQPAPLDDLLRASDFVSLHCRLTSRTRGMLGARELSLMKPSASLINVARGELVDQDALVGMLRAKRIAGAALDVFAVEPLPADDPLTRLDNVILTPHWSASTSDVWSATGEAMARGMLCAARGEPPPNVVNPEVLALPGFLEKLQRFAENRSIPEN